MDIRTHSQPVAVSDPVAKTDTLADGTVVPWDAARITAWQQAQVDAAAAAQANGNRLSLDGKVRAAVQVGGALQTALGTTADPAPALTAAAIKVASLRALTKLSNADTAANAGAIIQRIIALLIDTTVAERQIGKLGVQLHDEA